MNLPVPESSEQIRSICLGTGSVRPELDGGDVETVRERVRAGSGSTGLNRAASIKRDGTNREVPRCRFRPGGDGDEVRDLLREGDALWTSRP